jgi:hypothetical protein
MPKPMSDMPKPIRDKDTAYLTQNTPVSRAGKQELGELHDRQADTCKLK